MLQYRRTFSKQGKKALWKNNLTFSSRISIKQKSNQTEFQSNPLQRIEFIRSSQVSTEQEFAGLLWIFQTTTGRTKAVSWWNRCLRSLTATSLILPQALHKSKIFDEIHYGQHDASCVKTPQAEVVNSSNEVKCEISNWTKILFLLCKLNISIEMSFIMLNSVSEAFGPLEHPMFSSSEQ